MANVTTKAPGIIHIVLDGSTDWSYVTDGGFNDRLGMKVKSIQFNPSAANDRLVIRHAVVATGTIIHDTGPAGGTAPIYDPVDPQQREFPVIDASDLVLGTPTNASVIIRHE